jgi:hypothetical protein
MTIDRGREARRVAYGALVALSVWFGGMAVLALIVDPVAVIAFGPVDRISRAVVSADASVIAMGAGFHHRSRRRRRAAATSLRRRRLARVAGAGAALRVQVRRAVSGVHPAMVKPQQMSQLSHVHS